MTDSPAATSARPVGTAPDSGPGPAAGVIQHDPDRVAVVVVHGMGQQQPMGTLRELVNAYIQVCDARTRRMWSVADRYDGSFELHTFVVPPEPERAKLVTRAAAAAAHARGDLPVNAVRPRGQIDFYEGYWASDLRGTKLAHLVRWLVNILKHIFRHRKLRVIPLRLAWVWVPLLVLPVVFALALPWVIATYGDTTWYAWTARVVTLAVIPFAANWALSTLGDVARYLDVGVDNVAARHAIRENLVGLLAQLHDGGRYRRIVLIGHSLGGVVAYDALRLLWAQRIRDLNVADLDQQALLDTANALRAESRRLRNLTGRARRAKTAVENSPYGRARAAHLTAQSAAFDRLVDIGRSQAPKLGHAWLVSDLLTLGSPIAYPDLLIAPPGVPVSQLTRERILPTSPPQLAEELPGQDLASTAGISRIQLPAEEVDPRPTRAALGESTQRGRHADGYGESGDLEERRWGSYTFNSAVGGYRAPRVAVFHHGAVFAVTRWTNVYATADFVGNEIPDSLGPAVVNARLGQAPLPTSRWARRPVTSHTRYWKEPDGRAQIWAVIDRAARELPAFVPVTPPTASTSDLCSPVVDAPPSGPAARRDGEPPQTISLPSPAPEP